MAAYEIVLANAGEVVTGLAVDIPEGTMRFLYEVYFTDLHQEICIDNWVAILSNSPQKGALKTYMERNSIPFEERAAGPHNHKPIVVKKEVFKRLMRRSTSREAQRYFEIFDELVLSFARVTDAKLMEKELKIRELSKPMQDSSSWKEHAELLRKACAEAKKEASKAKKVARRATAKLRILKKSLTNQEENEREVSDRLARETGGRREVQTLSGRIDVLTDTEIIEVKRIDGWKHSIGQVLAYGSHFPGLKKRVHLFGRQDLMDTFFVTKAHIESICSHLGIVVTYEISIAIVQS